MSCIRELKTQREGICVNLDWHAGILNVFNNRDNSCAPPMTYHLWCMHHYVQNLFKHLQSKDLKDVLERACCENQKCKF
jgi:hypothetical protein